jgi:hypothetical protein
MAASFAAGAWLPWRLGSDPSESSWVEAVANYQALYVRETLDQAADSPAKLASLSSGFDDEQRRSLFVPDLRAVDLEFRRVQRLGYGDAPLIQMVYLPPSGKPLALCVLPVNRADAAVQARTIDSMSVASWRRRGLAFVLAADMPQTRLTQLARQLADDRFARL